VRRNTNIIVIILAIMAALVAILMFVKAVDERGNRIAEMKSQYIVDKTYILEQIKVLSDRINNLERQNGR
jgi:hypothetical protein